MTPRSLVCLGTLLVTPLFAAMAPIPKIAPEVLPAGTKVAALEIAPASVALNGTFDSAQILVTARLVDGTSLDATRLAKLSVDSAAAEVTPAGQLHARANGRATLTASLSGQSARAAVTVARVVESPIVDYVRDVSPVINRLGCSAGTCHGAKEGKVGFKLSLRGYDAIYDVRSLVDDHAGRRVNLASPDDSLMLLKATGAVPHEGGQRTPYDSKYYRILRAWIAGGAKLDPATPRVTKIEISPQDPVLQAVGSRQQMRIVATYADGRARDVTAEGFIESGNTDVVTVDEHGLVTTLRRGEAPVLARFEGNYAATTVTVMGDRSGFAWAEPEKWNQIDEFTAAKWQRLKILPSALAGDEEFLRRVYLDLTGLPPTTDEVRAFLADNRPVRTKRDAVIDRLIGSPEFVDHWANKWADLLQVNRKFLGEEGAKKFREWIRGEVAANTPYDAFARKILTATGSTRENPAASYYKVLRTPTETMENTTHLFLATRFNCNKCHDHPFERWTQDQYYELSAFFARLDLKKDPQSGNKTIAGTAVEGAKPLYEIVADKTDGEITHDRTGQITAPAFPYAAKVVGGALRPDSAAPSSPSRRESLAAWITSPDNRYFALSYTNRLWGYLTGVGLIDPLDDIRAGNPPSNPELLAYLTSEFVRSGFDTRQLLRLITTSRTYQLAVATHRWNSDDKTNYSHALARRLPAEVLLDSVFKVTGSTPKFPGIAAGTRAAQLPDSAIDLPSGFLANLGRPARESACECERNSDIGLGNVMALLSGPAVSDAIQDPKNDLAKLVAAQPDDRRLINEVFLRILNRPATPAEIDSTLAAWRGLDTDHQKLTAARAEREAWWVPILAKKETDRTAAIAAARAAVEARTIAIAPQVAEAEKKRIEKIAATRTALAAEEEKVPAAQAAWEAALPPARLGTTWQPLTFTTMRGSNNIKVTKQPDGAYLATGAKTNNVDVTLTGTTDLTGITGIMLEALPDNSLPNYGPGRANGNFVLTEIVLRTADKAAKRDVKDAKFKDARADFSQNNFDVKLAIDGKIDDARDGWAVSPRFGEPHYARFALAEPAGEEGGTTLTLILYHRFRDDFFVGRFRLWATTSTDPLELGLPSDIAAILKTPAAARTSEQATALTAYYRAADPALLKKQHALTTAERPLPEDSKLKSLKAALATAELPVPLDPKLAQLRADTEMSEKQQANHRLAATQDLAWALINTPAFLFNH
ncbi:MAG: DUF1549 domain-containing protein [Verrucomicrobia bacterium]|nr:DUF1549 domain-containing protein [Verrucomicrobiota bacterium]